MGWITFNKPNSTSPSQYFREMFSREPNHELLDVAIVKRNQAYMAVRLRDTGKVVALVYMLTYDNKSYYNFGYKSMDEFCGPGISKCPKRILKLLSPISAEDDPNGWATNWRNRCYENINKPKIKEGDIVKTNTSVEFTNGGEYNLFLRQKRLNRYFPLLEIDGQLVKINSTVRFPIKDFGYEILRDKKVS